MKRSSVVQCHRCQRYQHTAGQCNFKYRCVQCTADHAPGQCSRKSNNNLPMGCINCKEAGLTQFTGHTANNHSQCAYYKRNDKSNATNTKSNSIPSTKNKSGRVRASENHRDTSIQSSFHQPNANIDGDVAANNPHSLSKKKTKRQIQQYRPSLSGKSTHHSTTKQPKSNGSNKNNNVNGFIAALLNVLQKFS